MYLSSHLTWRPIRVSGDYSHARCYYELLASYTRPVAAGEGAVAPQQPADAVAHQQQQPVWWEAVRQYPEEGRGDGAGGSAALVARTAATAAAGAAPLAPELSTVPLVITYERVEGRGGDRRRSAGNPA